MKGSWTVPRILAICGILTMIVGGVGFIVVMALNAFVLDEFDAYGEVPIPGTGQVQLPAGEVQISFHTSVTGSPSGSFPIPALKLGIDPPAGAPDPVLTESRGTTTTVNSDTHIRIWTAQVPVAGVYQIRTGGSVSGYINPRLAFGHESNYDYLHWVFDVHSCGICGSDLHAKDHGDELADVLDEVGYHDCIRSGTPTVMGHEFSGEVAERGAKTLKSLKVGTRVVSFPMVRAHGGVQLTGLSPLAPGGYAEQVLVEAAMTFPVPNGLSMDIAALTEPMAVALHAVRRSDIKKRDTAIVIGCGPIGLAIICQLKALGVQTIVASDFSPGRRALAGRCGADIVVDPKVDSPYDKVAGKGVVTDFSGLADLAVGSMEKLRRLPGWQHIYRAADALGAAGPKRPVIFECVGVPGMIDGIITAAPLNSRVIVAGVCMSPDTIRPAMAIGKETDLRFVFGYTPLEFRDTLHMLADGKLNATPLVTGKVGLGGVVAAFEALGDPEAHAKILIDPRSEATAP